MKLWLIGMMGTGKTAAGRIAASELNTAFFDTDEVVAERMGCSIAQLWGSLGERAFRDLETVAMISLADSEGIVATGGGVVLSDRNRDLIRESGSAVWLRASPGVLARRLGDGDDRPLLREGVNRETIEKHLQQREPLYRSLADHEIETDDLHVLEVASIIGSIWAM
ncbi:MAG: shikimate kinase [Acidimicrobiia bacterium]|nr:shikimate kinase [Acidimicrobiia bacterium]